MRGAIEKEGQFITPPNISSLLVPIATSGTIFVYKIANKQIIGIT